MIEYECDCHDDFHLGDFLVGAVCGVALFALIVCMVFAKSPQ